jgi:NADPH:quinone reductase-like Zn-dependent oxidoreductase
VPLSDGAGTIVAIGDGVEGLEVGDWAIANFEFASTNLAFILMV